MKKLYFILITIICGMFVSCTDSEEVEFKSSLTIKTSLESAKSGFQEYKAGDFELSDEYRIRVTNYIYDENGKLVQQQQILAKQYTEDVDMNFVLPDGNYKVLTTSDVIKGNSLNTYDKSYWEPSNIESLNSIVITKQNIIGYNGMGILTLTETEIKLYQGKKEVFVKVKPVTAMIRAFITNIHAWDGVIMDDNTSRTMTYLEISYLSKWIDKAEYNNGNWNFNSSAPETSSYLLTKVDLTDSRWDNFSSGYGLISVLPGTYKFMGYARFIWSADSKEYHSTTDESQTLQLQSGQEYNVNFAVDEFDISFKEAQALKKREAVQFDIYANSELKEQNNSLRVKDIIK